MLVRRPTTSVTSSRSEISYATPVTDCSLDLAMRITLADDGAGDPEACYFSSMHHPLRFSRTPPECLVPPKARLALHALALTVAMGAIARPALAEGPTMAECLAANESAIKLRSDHKLKQAREQTIVCAAPTCPVEVRDACQARFKILDAAVASLVFEVKDPAGNNLTAVAVTMDGQPFADHLDGTAVLVDPGDHVFAFTAPGQPTVEQHLVVREGDRNRRELVDLRAKGAASPSAGASPATQPGAARSSGPGGRKINRGHYETRSFSWSASTLVRTCSRVKTA